MSLRWQVAISYFIIIAISFLMFGAVILNVLKQSYIAARKANLTKEANIISVVSARYIKDADSYLSTIISDFSHQLNSRVLILNHRGTVIMDAFNDLNIINRTLNNDEIVAALKGQSMAQQHYLPKDGWVMYTTVPITSQDEIIGVVFISSSLQDIYDTLSNIKRGMIGYSILLITVVSIFGFFIAGMITRPINIVTDVIKKMAQGHLKQRVKVKGSKELVELGHAFNIMSRQLENLDKARSEFVANASHELRTPLSSIKVLAQSLLQNDIKDIDVYKDFLNDINAEIDRMNNVINDLLYLVQLDKNETLTKRETVDLNDTIQEIIKLLRPISNSKNIRLIYECVDSIFITGDRLKIKQMIMNIIDNAIKYTDNNGEVIVKLYKDGNKVYIKVKDTGIGIPKADIPYIFERFYRVDKARSRATGGTGLGLSIAQKIAQQHGGIITVESVEGQGSTFTIELPANS